MQDKFLDASLVVQSTGRTCAYFFYLIHYERAFARRVNTNTNLRSNWRKVFVWTPEKPLCTSLELAGCLRPVYTAQSKGGFLRTPSNPLAYAPRGKDDGTGTRSRGALTPQNPDWAGMKYRICSNRWIDAFLHHGVSSQCHDKTLRRIYRILKGTNYCYNTRLLKVMRTIPSMYTLCVVLYSVYCIRTENFLGERFLWYTWPNIIKPTEKFNYQE